MFFFLKRFRGPPRTTTKKTTSPAADIPRIPQTDECANAEQAAAMFTIPKASNGSPSSSSVSGSFDTDTSAANLAAAGLLLPNFPIPTSNFNPFMPLSMGISPLSFGGNQLPQLGLNSNPMLIPPPSYEQAMAQLINSNPEAVRLAANSVVASLMEQKNLENEKIKNEQPMSVEVADNEEDDQPLDLSMKRSGSIEASTSSSSSSGGFRPSVIRGNSLVPTPRNTDIKRSASSVSYRATPDPDVSDHFRRSLSGKWPRRQPSHGLYSPNNQHLSATGVNNSLLVRQERSNSPFTTASIKKRLSFSSSPRSSCSSPNIRRVASTPKRTEIYVTEGKTGEVETHFIRSLGINFRELAQNREAAAAVKQS